MVMQTMQIRLSPGLIKKIDKLVRTGLYANRSDVIRDAVRNLDPLYNLVGLIPDNKDSVDEVKNLRKKLSKEKFDPDKINSLLD